MLHNAERTTLLHRYALREFPQGVYIWYNSNVATAIMDKLLSKAPFSFFLKSELIAIQGYSLVR
ncbi:hypothetical protein ACWWJF_24270 [Symbiopectobacterium sp. Eva_TO]